MDASQMLPRSTVPGGLPARLGTGVRRAGRWRGRALAGATLGALLLAACGDDGGTAAPPSGSPDLQLASSLRRFDSCEEVRTWARDELAPRVGAYGFSGGGDPVIVEDGDVGRSRVDPDLGTGGGDDMATESADGAAGAGDAAAPAPSGGEAATPAPERSGTNVQVEGVDEPDLVKTDGDRMVVLAGSRVHLVSVEGQELLDAVDLPHQDHGGEMLLAGDRALVFSSGWSAGPVEADTERGLLPEAPQVRVVQVDIDGDRLSVSETYELDGSYVSARQTGDVVRLVVQAEPQQRLPFVTPAAPGEEAEERARELNRQVVEEAGAGDLLPRWRQIGSGDEVVDEGDLVTCEQAHAPETFSGFGVVAVVSIDVSDGLGSGVTSSNGAGVMAAGQTVYSSAESLYVAAPRWVDRDEVSGGEASGDDVAGAEQGPGTDIHRFDISDPGQAGYEMSGHVDGTLLNQFAMDEHDGHLRVATTTGSPWAGGEAESESHVVVLEPGDGELTQVGSVSGLGPGETIHAVRFMGDVGYVVTFEQTDPLYTIDLSDPADPRMVGELEMLGYSAYLHPVGDGRLVGVGQDATEEGVTQGVQISLFDVGDPADPRRVAQTTVPDAWSAVEGDHRAFLWWADTGLLAVPVEAWQGPEAFTGVVGYSVDVEGADLQELGRISHPGGWFDEPVPLPEPLPVEPGGGGGGVAPSDVVPPDRPVERSEPIQRTLVIDGEVWTVSASGLRVSDLATLEPGAFIELGGA